MRPSSIYPFKFQPENIQTGMVYHSIKSNIDGSWPARIFIRVEDKENLNVWKFEAHQADAAHVRAHMDWQTSSADHIESWIVAGDGKSHHEIRQLKPVVDRTNTTQGITVDTPIS